MKQPSWFDRYGRKVNAIALAVTLLTLAFGIARADVNGEYQPGINITKNGLEVQGGNVNVKQGAVEVQSANTPPTGGMPAQGNVNIKGTYYQNNTPVPGCILPAATPANGTFLESPDGLNCVWATPVPTLAPPAAPTAFPTAANGALLEGTGAQGIQAGVAALTANTPPAGTIPYCAAGGAGCVMAWATPIPGGVGCTGYPCGSGITVIGPTYLVAGSASLTTSFADILSLGSVLTSSKSYNIHAQANVVIGSGTDYITCKIYDSTNAVDIAMQAVGQLAASTNTFLPLTIAKPYSGYAGAPTIKLACKEAGGGTDSITADASGVAHITTYIFAEQIT